jgi:hypothetical protein
MTLILEARVSRQMASTRIHEAISLQAVIFTGKNFSSLCTEHACFALRKS